MLDGILQLPWGYLCHGRLKGSTGMGAGLYRHDTKGGKCCRVGGGVGGGSSGRAKFAAACLAVEDSLTHDQLIVVLTDSKGLMAVAWGGQGSPPATFP